MSLQTFQILHHLHLGSGVSRISLPTESMPDSSKSIKASYASNLTILTNALAEHNLLLPDKSPTIEPSLSNGSVIVRIAEKLDLAMPGLRWQGLHGWVSESVNRRHNYHPIRYDDQLEHHSPISQGSDETKEVTGKVVGQASLPRQAMTADGTSVVTGGHLNKRFGGNIQSGAAVRRRH